VQARKPPSLHTIEEIESNLQEDYTMHQVDMRKLTRENILRYIVSLQEQEKSSVTITQYAHDLSAVEKFFHGEAMTKVGLIRWKDQLVKKYATSSSNTMIAALNGFLKFMGWNDLTIKALKVKKSMFSDESRELTQAEYQRLIHAADRADQRRLSLVMQTICATGIRVSELQFITVQAVQTGRAEISNKGSYRTVFLPKQLRIILTRYIKKQHVSAGPVFVTRNGKPLDRSNIWRDMKALCKSAGVPPQKVFPHNLRHLFARTYYSIEKDLSRLADILGHTSINTTRIYTIESGAVHARQLEQLGLIIT